MARKISLQKGEGAKGNRLYLLRLDDTGAGSLEKGDQCRVSEPTTNDERSGVVVSVERKRLRELNQNDASRLLVSPDNDLPDLLQKIEQYRFRPQWEQASTEFRILEIELSDEADGGE